MRRSAVLLGLALLLVACSKLDTPSETSDGDGGGLGGGRGSGEPVDPTATFMRVQNEIFTPGCSQLACHDTLGRQEQLVLIAGQSFSNIVNVASNQMPQLQRIAPNDPANSYLYRKVVGAGITGDRMPQNLSPLTDAQTKLLRDWIRRGAPND
ncbi:MAG TPA: hypothetical protein VGV61_12770 [Thermoanaerobaculia bacterium]|jgi:hypothetical protein|nr:hypothetical protein [Thermoanaerobaculia bacterium]